LKVKIKPSAMKQYIKIFAFVFLSILFQACKKDNSVAGTGTGTTSQTNFFANTEWTGIETANSQTFPKPVYLHFNGDKTVSVYALFNWVIGNDQLAIDSVVGDITNIDITSGVATISVNFPYTNDQQVYTITDKKELKGGSSATTKATTYTSYAVDLQLCPSTISPVSGSDWNTKTITTPGPTAGGLEFPDISNFSFIGDRDMTFVRGGKTLTYSPPTQDQVDKQGFIQIGPKIYFAGYNESMNIFLHYFGVLTPDGQTILADTRGQYARLPYYYQTIFWYGDPGVTPNTHKQ
jgi:hypothetical protein